ncbi:MAG: DUF1153 domain-containing protein [Alphaproteobacteria bacterium]|nr:DUF1153 domain-containing protein [Alphaproteobacteria bacterium]
MSKGSKSSKGKVVKIMASRSALADLPSPNTRRWVPRRKAEVVAAVDKGVLTSEEACERYNLTMEEFESWNEMVRRHGQKGLRVTRLQKYQDRPLRRPIEVPS